MASIFFYPRLTDEMIVEAGYTASEYEFMYVGPHGLSMPLVLDRGRTCSLTDDAEIWRLRDDGLALRKEIVIEYPDRLKGAAGLVPKDARILPCLLWTSRKMSTTGVILPEVVADRPVLKCVFEHAFKPGSIAGDIEFDLAMYVVDSAEVVELDERHLMNSPGVILGSLENPVYIDFEGETAEFPIEEFEDPDGPLWRVRFESWDDPREDTFSAESFTLMLNAKHPDCPRVGIDGVKNQGLLQEVLCGAMFLLFEKVRDFGDETIWRDTINGSDLTPGSISSVLNWFSQKGEDAFDWSSPEGRMLSIKRIIDQSYAAAKEDR